MITRRGLLAALILIPKPAPKPPKPKYYPYGSMWLALHHPYCRSVVRLAFHPHRAVFRSDSDSVKWEG